MYKIVWSDASVQIGIVDAHPTYTLHMVYFNNDRQKREEKKNGMA